MTGYLDPPFAALAHRGFSRDGLENSMAAFAAAVDLGFRYVETDAHATADGYAVALHDATLDRTTDGHGRVRDLPWREVREARIGGVEPVPLLEDLLGAFPDVRVNIDVKEPTGVFPVAQAIERTRSHGRVLVASFAAARRRETLRRLTRPVAGSAGTAEIARFLLDVRLGRPVSWLARRVDCLQVPTGARGLTVVDERTVAAAHDAGLRVHVWTVNDPDRMRRLLDLGVDGLISDRADVLREVLEERGMWS